MDRRVFDLGFLLSLSHVLTGCGRPTLGDVTVGAGTGTSSDAMQTTSGVAGGDHVDPNVTNPGVDTSAGPSTTAAVTTTPPMVLDVAMVDIGGGNDTSGYAPACEAYAAAVSYCYPDGRLGFDGYASLCQDYLDYYTDQNPDCGAAWEELFACLGGLSCDQIANNTGCDDQITKVGNVCMP